MITNENMGSIKPNVHSVEKRAHTLESEDLSWNPNL